MIPKNWQPMPLLRREYKTVFIRLDDPCRIIAIISSDNFKHRWVWWSRWYTPLRRQAYAVLPAGYEAHSAYIAAYAVPPGYNRHQVEFYADLMLANLNRWGDVAVQEIMEQEDRTWKDMVLSQHPDYNLNTLHEAQPLEVNT